MSPNPLLLQAQDALIAQQTALIESLREEIRQLQERADRAENRARVLRNACLTGIQEDDLLLGKGRRRKEP